MISNSTIRNCTKSFPPIQGLMNEQVLGKILIKNIYQAWTGESISEIKDKHEVNPYSLRVGKPSTDSQIKGDRMYFIPNYLAYNSFTKEIEKRELVSYRNMDVVYIGQSIDEHYYKNYKLFVDGKVVVDDIIIKRYDDLKDTSVGQLLMNLVDKVEKLQVEIAVLKRQSKNSPIYTKDKG
jgi:hypothetical protein